RPWPPTPANPTRPACSVPSKHTATLREKLKSTCAPIRRRNLAHRSATTCSSNRHRVIPNSATCHPLANPMEDAPSSLFAGALCSSHPRKPVMDSDPLKTQRDVGSAVVSELSAAGFDDAEEIGRGGFGIVFRCRQAALGREVAVKVLTAELDQNRERFVREQRAMGVLTGHPNIVGVLHVGETESHYPYLVMQYHRPGSLDARIHKLGALPPDEVLRLGVKLAGALETAHRAEILHRDIKPA